MYIPKKLSFASIGALVATAPSTRWGYLTLNQADSEPSTAMNMISIKFILLVRAIPVTYVRGITGQMPIKTGRWGANVFQSGRRGSNIFQIGGTHNLINIIFEIGL